MVRDGCGKSGGTETEEQDTRNWQSCSDNSREMLKGEVANRKRGRQVVEELGSGVKGL